MADHDENLRLAARAQQDVNSYQAKQKPGVQSDSTVESGVDQRVQGKFPETEVRYGREAAAASGSDRKPIPEKEGGEYDDRGRLTHAKDFEGPDGPEEQIKARSERWPGDDSSLNAQEMKQKGIYGK